ncbi:MAG TPA: DUF4395 domain-containing protein [Spirochaetia bacterium]|nr:DUF4395 domain-containing protein [Spirochaetia bacterium]
MPDRLGKVDHSSLRVTQGSIIVLLLFSFVLNSPWLVAVVAVLMLAGSAVSRPGFFFIYLLLLRPAGIVKPDVLPDNPEPHRFAQGFGGVVAAVSALATLLGAAALGWALAWLVIALAALNLFAGFCVGCAVYYWLHRLQVPGFSKNPPAGVAPGMRPRP